jgi:hypothetical protein
MKHSLNEARAIAQELIRRARLHEHVPGRFRLAWSARPERGKWTVYWLGFDRDDPTPRDRKHPRILMTVAVPEDAEPVMTVGEAQSAERN